MKTTLLLSLALSLAFQAVVHAESLVPKLMNYQGYLTDSAGLPLGEGASENRKITFRFWTNPTDLADEYRLWARTYDVTILDGNFSVLLGSGGTEVAEESDLAASFNDLFDHPALYLGITVDDDNDATFDAEITPRQQLVSPAFAFRAAVAERVDLEAITHEQIAANAITDLKIANNAVGQSKLKENAVGTAQIAAGAVTAAEIATGAVDTAEIAADAVTAAKIATSAVTSVEIANATIVGDDIATNTITQNKIAHNSIGSGELKDNAVKAEHLGDGTVRAANDSQVIRIIYGRVQSDGNKRYGSGWTSTKTATGKYRITFDQSFISPPTVTVSQIQLEGNDDNILLINHSENSNCTVYIKDNEGSNAGDFENDEFNFIAVGPVSK